MKKRNLIVIATIIFMVLLLLFFSNSILLKDIFKSSGAKNSKSQATSEHQGHAGGIQPLESQVQAAHEQMPEEPPIVEIPLDKQQLIGVKITTAELKQVQKSIRTVGQIVYDEKKLSTINTKFEGWIEKLYADYTGKFVKKGDSLTEIYSPELYATQIEFLNLLKWTKHRTEEESAVNKMLLKDADSILEAAKQRLRLWDITDEQIKKIEETGKPIRTLTIYSPTSGYIVQKTALQGVRVMPGDKLFDIADLSTVWVIADIYEYELPLVDVGQEAEITLSYLPSRTFKSKIEFVYPNLSADTRTLKIRFSLPNNDNILKPNMYTTVTIKQHLGRRLIIPEDAVIDTGIRQIVYIDKGEGYFEPREIITGIRADGLVEVIKGLKAGEKIASSATFLIDSEAQLKGVKPLGNKH